MPRAVGSPSPRQVLRVQNATGDWNHFPLHICSPPSERVRFCRGALFGVLGNSEQTTAGDPTALSFATEKHFHAQTALPWPGASPRARGDRMSGRTSGRRGRKESAVPRAGPGMEAHRLGGARRLRVVAVLQGKRRAIKPLDTPTRPRRPGERGARVKRGQGAHQVAVLLRYSVNVSEDRRLNLPAEHVRLVLLRVPSLPKLRTQVGHEKAGAHVREGSGGTKPQH